MVKCCVLWCENDSLKKQDVAFHQLPPGAYEKSLYDCMDASSEDELFACSEHYNVNDFVKNQDGKMRLKIEAIPIIKLCTICLQTNVKLIDMNQYNLKIYFQDIIGVNVELNNDLYLNNLLCIECAHRLRNYHKFKEKSILANKLLMNLLEKNKQMSQAMLNSLSQERSQLKSNLTYKNYGPDYFDIKVDKTEQLDEIKYEYEIDVNDVKNNETRIKNESDTKEVLDIAISSDIDNVASLSDYSTDDDVTLKEFDEMKYEVEIDLNDIQNNEIYIKKYTEVVRDMTNSSDVDSSDDDLTLKEIEEEKEKIKPKLDAKKKEAIKKKPLKIDRRRKPLTIDGVNSNLFNIIQLSLDEQMEVILKRKETLNFKNSPFQCMECFKGFVDARAYSTHMRRHSDEFGPFACPICKAHFKTLSRVKKHKSSTHSYEYRCNQCSFISKNRPSAKLHESWHKGKVYNCKQCSEVFIKFTTYMGHLRIKHPSNFVCELCGYAFVSKKGIMLHKKLKHISSEKVPGDGPLCEPCNIRFLSENAYNNHLTVSAKHNNDEGIYPNRPLQVRVKGIRRVKCDDVQESNCSPQDLICEQCGMQMTNSKEYHQHFRRMHPDKNRTLNSSKKEPCMCEKCGKMFQTCSHLKDHLKTHTNDSRYKCTQCDKAFKKKRQLAVHLLTHKKIRVINYPCHICGKSFSKGGNRQRHMIIHTGLRPHQCEMCPKSFKTSTDKKTHVNYVHLKKPWPKRAPRKRSGVKQGQNIQSTHGVSETDEQTRPQRKKLGVVSDKPVYE